MKKIFYILFLTYISLSAFAQERKDSIAKKESKWSVGFNLSPNIGYRKKTNSFIIPNINSDITSINITGLPGESWGTYWYNNSNDVEILGFGINTGIFLKRKISKGINITMGLNKNDIKYQTKLVDSTFYIFTYYPIPGIDTFYINSHQFFFKHSFIAVPLLIEWKFLHKENKNYSSHLSAGIAPSYFLNARLRIKNSSKSFDYYANSESTFLSAYHLSDAYGGFGKLNFQERIYYWGIAEIGLHFPAFKKWTYSIESYFMYMINPLIIEEYIPSLGLIETKKLFFYSMGLNFSMHYRIK